MPRVIKQISDKVRSAIEADERDKTPNDMLGKIQVAYICNDENNPIGVHPHGPAPYPHGSFSVNRTDNKGGFRTVLGTHEAQRTVISSSGLETTILDARGAGVRQYVTTIIISQRSAVTALVTIRDGTAGSVVIATQVSATTGDTKVFTFPFPIRLGDNNALTAQLSDATITVDFTVVGFQLAD